MVKVRPVFKGDYDALKDDEVSKDAKEAVEVNLSEISTWMEDTSKAAGEEVEDDDEDDEADEEPQTEEEKVAAHKSKWEKRKAKYRKYADKGKVDKLKRALEKQTAKHQKAIDKGKSEAYIEYKAAKMDYTKGLIKLAKIMEGLKKSGLL